MDDRGQASIELVAALPALLLAALVALQLLAVGYSASLADGAAEAGAMAAAAGLPVEPAAADALPGWARGRFEASRDGNEVTVTLRPPSPLEALADRLEVTSSSWVRTPDGG